jgi:hypothetical protein
VSAFELSPEEAEAGREYLARYARVLLTLGDASDARTAKRIAADTEMSEEDAVAALRALTANGLAAGDGEGWAWWHTALGEFAAELVKALAGPRVIER